MKTTHKIIKKPLIVILLTIFITIVGIMGLKIIPLEKFPDVVIPKVIVSIPYIGASPKELENEVIKKVEEKIRKINNVKKITSNAVYSKATIVVEFNDSVKSDRAKDDVQTAVNEAIPDLPSGIETPIISAVDVSDRAVMTITLYGDMKDYLKLRDIAEDIQTPLEGVNGVSSVDVFGGYEREIAVEINPLKLEAYKISIDYLINFLKTTNLNLPGGNIDLKKSKYPLRIIGRLKNIKELQNSIVKYRQTTDGTSKKIPVYLKDIAKVHETNKDIETISRFNGKSCVSLQIRKKSGFNMIKLSKSIRGEMKVLNKRYLITNKLKYTITGDESDDIKSSTNSLFSSIIQGIIIIFLVLSVGMGVKNGLIASLAIPMCLLVTIGAVLILGYTLNNLIQFGLIIVIGMVVDGAIVILENIYRHRGMGKSKEEATVRGLNQVSSGIIASLLTTMAAFAPLLFMKGTVGKFLAYIPVAVILALAGSFLFDHFLLPILANKFMSDPLNTVKIERIKKKEKKEKSKSNRFINFYKKVITNSIERRGLVFITSIVILIIGIFIFSSLKSEFFPDSNNTKIYISFELPPISNIQQTNNIAKRLEKDVLIKYVDKKIIKYFVTSIGKSSGSVMSKAQLSADAVGNIDIELHKLEDRNNFPIDKMVSIIRKYVKDISGVRFTVEKKRSGPSTGDPINVVISGSEIRILKKISRNIQSMIRKNVKGAVDIKDNYGVGLPQIVATVDRVKANLHGISVQAIAATLSNLYNGNEVSNYYFGEKEVKIKLRIQKKFAKQINDLQKIFFYKSSTGKMLPLSELVKIEMKPGLTIIAREEMIRSITVSGNAFGRSSTEVMADIKTLLKDFSLPNGYKIQFKGENEDRDESMKSLLLAFGAAFLLMYFIIAFQLQSFSQPISILFTIVLSITGVAIGLAISGSRVGIMAMFGFISLAGVVVNDAIVLITYINEIRENGVSRKQAIIEACITRLRPIMMTTITTIAGMLPLAFGLGGDSATSNFWMPLAWAIIGGLTLATMQTLIFVPIVYSLIEDFNKITKSFFSRVIKHISRFTIKIFERLFSVKVTKISKSPEELGMTNKNY